MYLKIHSDCSYLSLPNARSRVRGHFYFGNEVKLDKEDINNSLIYTECSVLKPVVSSAAEGELASTFVNAQKGVILRNTANELGWPQKPTPFQTDNTTAMDIISDTIKPKRSKTMDMRLHWLRDRKNNNQFIFYWNKGTINKADYPSKHHNAAHHKRVRSTYLCNNIKRTNFKKMHRKIFTCKGVLI